MWGRLWRTLAVATFEIKAPEHNLPASQSDVHLMQHWQSTDQRLAPFHEPASYRRRGIKVLGQLYISRVTQRLELRRSERTNEIDTRIEVGGHLPASLHNFVLAVGRTC